jgi:hypothetical protein
VQLHEMGISFLALIVEICSFCKPYRHCLVLNLKSTFLAVLIDSLILVISLKSNCAHCMTEFTSYQLSDGADAEDR